MGFFFQTKHQNDFTFIVLHSWSFESQDPEGIPAQAVSEFDEVFCSRYLFDVRSLKELDLLPMFQSCEKPETFAWTQLFNPLVDLRAVKNEGSEY